MQLSSYTARTPEDKVTEKRAVQRQYKEAILCQIMGALTTNKDKPTIFNILYEIDIVLLLCIYTLQYNRR